VSNRRAVRARRRGERPCNTGGIRLESFHHTRRDRAMEQFIFTLSRPDNIPITILLISAVICLYVALKQAFKNDRLIEEGREDEIYEDMIK